MVRGKVPVASPVGDKGMEVRRGKGSSHTRIVRRAFWTAAAGGPIACVVGELWLVCPELSLILP